MKKLAVIIALALFATVGALAAAAETIVGTVTRVSDGDTIWVTDAKTRHKVRLVKIDAPESDQPHGKESTEFLKSLVYGKRVEVLWSAKDRYGRILGTVTIMRDNEVVDVNLAMVENGFAWHYSFNDRTPEYADAEKAAKRSRLGLWRAESPVNPYHWRKSKRQPKNAGRRNHVTSNKS